MLRRISFGDLKIGDLAKRNVNQALNDNWVSEGKFVDQFELEWGNKFGYKHSIAMSSGTDACLNSCLALYDFGANRGDEIICPALTFVATANAILAAGFTPKFVDIDRNTLNIDESKIEESITSKTRGIMVAHIMGKPCKMDVIMQIAKKHSLYVFEDSCEAHSAKYKGQYIGSFGHAASFSFYTAHIISCGEGGMCSTNDKEFADVIRSTKTHGRRQGRKFFDFVRLGLNSKMTDLCAAIGLEGISLFDEVINRRVEIRDRISNSLSKFDKIWIQTQEDHEFIGPHAFPIVFKEDNMSMRDNFYQYLETHGVECKTLFGCLPTQHACFGFLNYSIGDFPEAEFVGRNGLHFGLNQHLTDDDVDYLTNLLIEFLDEVQ